jgi:phenylacetate-CoA ligase
MLPAVDLARRRTGFSTYLPEYEASQWLSRRELEALQLTKLNALLAHAWKSVPYLARRWRDAGLRAAPLSSVSDLAAYPVITKSEITANYTDMISTAWRGRTHRKTTGGSTGEPFAYEFNRESDARRNAVMWRGYGWAGSRPGIRTLYLWSVPSSGGWLSRLKEQAFHAAFNRVFLDSFSLREDLLSEYARRIAAAEPEIVVGYVSALTEMSRWALTTGHRLYSPGSVITGAESLTSVDRDLISSAFGCPVYNTYGCREVMLIASECPAHDGLHVNQDHLVVELLDEQGINTIGSPGRVVLTDLHNYAMPLVRYENGDMASAAAHECSCGRGLPLLERVDGRVLDVIRTNDGRIVPGEYFPHSLKDVTGLREFQIIQEALDKVRVLAVLEEGTGGPTLESISSIVQRGVGAGTRVEIEQVPRIARSPSGKRRVTVSTLSRASAG